MARIPISFAKIGSVWQMVLVRGHLEVTFLTSARFSSSFTASLMTVATNA